MTLNRRDYYSAIPQLEKNLSKLSKYVTVSEGKIQIKIEDLYGNISTLTQTAEMIEGRVADAEDNISTLSITAQQIEGRVADAEGNISTLTQTASSLTSRITAAETEETRLSGVVLALEDADDAFELALQGLVNRVSTAETSITQNANAITLKANASDVYTSAETDALLAEYTKTAEFTVAPDQILATVNAAIATAESYTDGELADYPTTVEMNSAISQSANAISTSVSQTYQTISGMSDYVLGTTFSQTVNSLTTTITEKARVFTSRPTPPYAVGDLWADGTDIYKCKTSRASGNYSSSDWELASDYTDDTTANSAYSLASGEITTRTTMIRTATYGGYSGTLTCYVGASRGSFVSADGAFYVVNISWSGSTPTITGVVSKYGSDITIGSTSNANYMRILTDRMQIWDSAYSEKAIELNGNHSGTTPYIDIGWDQSNLGVHSRLTDSRLTFYVSGGSGSLWGGLTLSDGDAYIGASRFISNYYIEAGTCFRSAYTYKNPSDSVTTPTVYVNSSGTFMKVKSSSRRYKCDIENADRSVFDPHKLYGIPFRQFRYKEGYFGEAASDDAYTRLYQGFIAEEVLEAYPFAAVIEEDGNVETWSDRELIPPMLALIQEQNKRITELERKIA